MGAAYFIWPLLTFPLLLSLFLRGDVRIPPRFGLWILFLAWMALSAVQIDEGFTLLLFAYRFSLYLSATILFLYVFNASRDQLSDRTVITVLVLFWVLVIAGGYLGVLFPSVSFSTPVEALVPAAFLREETAYYFVHPAFSEVMTFLGYPVGRPKTLFAYSNQWGAAVAVLTPFALAGLAVVRRGLQRHVLQVLLVLSIVPIVISLNRGMWLSLGSGLAYVALRLAGRRSLRPLGIGLIGVAVAALIIFGTPLGGLVSDRLSNPNNSNETRSSVYLETLERVRESPLLGYRSPQGKIHDDQALGGGAQGQLFTILFSHGVPALLFFVGWIGYTVVRTARGGSPGRFWAHAALLILLIQLPYYNFLPTTLHVVMVAAALAWRDVVDPGSGLARERRPRKMGAPRTRLAYGSRQV